VFIFRVPFSASRAVSKGEFASLVEDRGNDMSGRPTNRGKKPTADASRAEEGKQQVTRQKPEVVKVPLAPTPQKAPTPVQQENEDEQEGEGEREPTQEQEENDLLDGEDENSQGNQEGEILEELFGNSTEPEENQFKRALSESEEV
jgi:hypothetical protein